MIDMLKKKMLDDYEYIVKYLDSYNYPSIKVNKNYISFGRDVDYNQKAVVIYLSDNDALIVKDFSSNITCDIFNYVIKTRSVTFTEAIARAKLILGISNSDFFKSSHREVFGGLYSKMKKKKEVELRTLPENYLNRFEHVFNYRFLKDGISLEVQHEFKIGYDLENNGITIPLSNEFGELVGVKERLNTDEKVPNKYFYETPCPSSQLLYGYAENYEYLQGAKVIYIVEAEKSVMQAASMGMRNFVGIGSSSLSKKQAKMLVGLHAEMYVFAHDKGLYFDAIKRNALMLFSYNRMREYKVGWLNMESDNSVKDKESPTDNGLNEFERIRKEHLCLLKKEDL